MHSSHVTLERSLEENCFVSVKRRASCLNLRLCSFLFNSLRSKRFRLVSEKRSTKTGERDFRFWRREKWNESQKMKEGGVGKNGRKPSLPFFPTPPCSFTRAIFHAVFDSRSSFFAPKPNGNACYAGYLFKNVVMSVDVDASFHSTGLHGRVRQR